MIEINNQTNRPIPEYDIMKWASFVLEEEKKDQDLSIAFIGSNKMRKINYKYRGKNKRTDVLAFEDLGEVIICLRDIDRKKSNLMRTVIHGVLHIIGYDHEIDDIMLEKEEKYFKLCQKI